MHSGALGVDPLSQKNLGVKIYNTSDEYESIPFDAACPEVLTRFYCLRCTNFWRRWSHKFTKLVIKSKALDVFDAC